MTRTARILLVALAAALAAPPAAGAATVTLAGGTVTFTAASGEDNRLTIGYDDSGSAYMTFADTGVESMTAGAGCSIQDAQTVRCPVSGVTGAVVVDLGDGNDYLGSGVFGRVTAIHGGLGNDTIHGGVDDDLIDGGAGTDTIDGRAGGDVIDGGEGPDLIVGNAGRDTVTYASRAGGVGVSLDAMANDGAPGEGDNVAVSVENLIGGSGDDSLTGGDAGNSIFGGAGADTLAGQGEGDMLEGGTGVDSYSGGAGVDRIASRDGVAEAVACGSEADTATIDQADAADADCEAVTRGADTDPLPAAPILIQLPPIMPPAPAGGIGNVVEAPVAAVAAAAPVGDDGTARVRVKCPSEAFEGCTGSVAIMELAATGQSRLDVQSSRRRKSTKLGSRRFKVAAGKGATVPVRLDRRSFRKLKKRKRVKVQVNVTMENAAGTTTKTRTVTLRRTPAKAKKKKKKKTRR